MAGILQITVKEMHHPAHCENPKDNPTLLMLHSRNLLLISCTIRKDTYFDK